MRTSPVHLGDALGKKGDPGACFASTTAWSSPSAVPRGGGAAYQDGQLPRLGDAGPRRKCYYNILALLLRILFPVISLTPGFIWTQKILSFFSLVPLGSAFRSLQAFEALCKCMRPSRFCFYLISFQINRAGLIPRSAEPTVHPSREPGPKPISSESSWSCSTPPSLRACGHHQAHRKPLPIVFDRTSTSCCL